MSFGTTAIHPSTFTVETVDRDAVTADALLRTWREGETTADPAVAAYSAWEAARAAREQAFARVDELEDRATLKYGPRCTDEIVEVPDDAGGSDYVYSDKSIDAFIEKKIEAWRQTALKADVLRVNTRRGWVPFSEMEAKLKETGEKLRLQLRAKEREVAAIRQEFGMDEADDAYSAACDAVDAAFEALMTSAPTTPDGVAKKLGAAAAIYGWADGKVVGGDEHSAFATILIDLQRLGGRN